MLAKRSPKGTTVRGRYVTNRTGKQTGVMLSSQSAVSAGQVHSRRYLRMWDEQSLLKIRISSAGLSV
jgi:hypothetical protein